MVQFGYIVTFSILIPILVGLLRLNKIGVSAKWLLYMLFPVAVNQFISIWYGSKGVSNFPFYYIYIAIETVFITIIYRRLLKTNFLRQALLLSSLGLVLTMIIYLLIDFNKIWESPDYFRAGESVIVLFFASAYFVEIFKRQEILYLHEVASFWISSGVILYFACNLMLFTFNKVLLQYGNHTALYIWTVHGILNVLLYISFTIALLCKKKEVIS